MKKDLFEEDENSIAARDKGMALAIAGAGSDWMQQGLAAIPFIKEALVTGESIRYTLGPIIGWPRPQAWGALVGLAKQYGLIVPTGQRVKMQDIKSHARTTDVYRITRRGHKRAA